jgi:hypothetical protein
MLGRANLFNQGPDEAGPAHVLILSRHETDASAVFLTKGFPKDREVPEEIQEGTPSRIRKLRNDAVRAAW